MKIVIFYSGAEYKLLCPSIAVKHKQHYYFVPLRAEIVDAADEVEALSLARPKEGEIVLNTIEAKKGWRCLKRTTRKKK